MGHVFWRGEKKKEKKGAEKRALSDTRQVARDLFLLLQENMTQRKHRMSSNTPPNCTPSAAVLCAQGKRDERGAYFW